MALPQASSLLKAQQAVEESSVAAERLAKGLRRNVVAAIPLLLEVRAFFGEELCDPLYCPCDQSIGLFDCFSGVVSELALGLVPARAQVGQFFFREQRRMPFGHSGRVGFRRKNNCLLAQVREVGITACVRGCIRYCRWPRRVRDV